MEETARNNYQGVLQPRGFPPLPQDWTSEWETFPSSDGKLQLFAVTHHLISAVNAAGNGRALVVLHGHGEHGGRYLHFPHYVRDTVDTVYCLDLRGHGRSEGLRGHVDRFDLFTEDVALAIHRLDDQLRKRFGKSEIHVQAHSMGGLIGLRLGFLNKSLPVRSFTISAPLLGLRVHVPPVKKLVGQALSNIWGTLHMNSELDATKVSRDPEVVSAYLADRLNHSKVTPRFFTEMTRAMADTVKRHSGFDYPIQMMVPLQDQIVDPEVTLQFFRELKCKSSSDKVLKTYAGFYHEPYNEIGKEQVFEDLKSWITAHASP